MANMVRDVTLHHLKESMVLTSYVGKLSYLARNPNSDVMHTYV